MTAEELQGLLAERQRDVARLRNALGLVRGLGLRLTEDAGMDGKIYSLGGQIVRTATIALGEPGEGDGGER